MAGWIFGASVIICVFLWFYLDFIVFRLRAPVIVQLVFPALLIYLSFIASGYTPGGKAIIISNRFSELCALMGFIYFFGRMLLVFFLLIRRL